jgi:hypothetical protein
MMHDDVPCSRSINYVGRHLAAGTIPKHQLAPIRIVHCLPRGLSAEALESIGSVACPPPSHCLCIGAEALDITGFLPSRALLDCASVPMPHIPEAFVRALLGHRAGASAARHGIPPIPRPSRRSLHADASLPSGSRHWILQGFSHSVLLHQCRGIVYRTVFPLPRLS